MDLLDSLVSKILNSASLIYKNKITEHTWHIKLKLNGDSFKNYIPGQQLRLWVGLGHEKLIYFNSLVRTYSVWHFDLKTQEVDIAISTFSNGPGSKWVQTVPLGETVYFTGPTGKFTIDYSANTYLFLGDISALAPLYELNRHLKEHQKSIGLIYSNNRREFFSDLFSSAYFGFVQSAEQHSQKIIGEINGHHLQKDDTIVYIAGETAFCKEMNNHFRKILQWDAKRIKTKPFWHPDKKGLE